MPVSEDQKSEILKLVNEGLGAREIAQGLGVPNYTVRGIMAWYTRTTGHTTEDGDDAVVEAIEAAFGLERDLQLALRANITQLEPGLTISDDGKEQTVSSGRIDIAAEDKQGNAVVIELKAGTADRDAIGQILSYMGDLGADKQVRGILVAGDFTARAISAAHAVPNVALKQYSFHFSFAAVTKSRINITNHPKGAGLQIIGTNKLPT